MQTEIEAKFLDIDFDILRAKLVEQGAKLEVPMRLMRRVAIHNDLIVSKNAFLRVRDEGDKVTLTYKQIDSLSLEGAREIEVNVSDFDKTIALLEQVGLKYHTYQETKRETWSLMSCEIVLDEWPWLKPYAEVEGPNRAAVLGCVARLGLDFKKAVFGDVMVAYRAQYDHLLENETIGILPIVKFGDPLPDILKKSA